MTGRLFVWGTGPAGRLTMVEENKAGSAGKEGEQGEGARKGGERKEAEGGGAGKVVEQGGGVSWRPPDGALLVDVSCGMHMTIVVDDRGRIWSFGDNKVTVTDPPDRVISQYINPLKDMVIW